MIPDLVFDLGMHEGADTEYYLRKGFRVVAVDANPHLCDAARAKFAQQIAAGRLTILNIGIGPNEGEFEFYINKNKTDWSSFVKNFADRAVENEIVRIRCFTLDWLLRTFGVPYYLKIDLEGFDRDCIVSLTKMNEFPRYVSVEATVGDFVDLMAPLGYTRFKIVNQIHIQFLDPMYPPLEGQFTDMKITAGVSSGQIGDETYGPWLTVEEFRQEHELLMPPRQYEGSAAQRSGVPEERYLRGWNDFHAKLGV